MKPHRPCDRGEQEIAAWLLEEENENEVVYLKLDRSLDGEVGANSHAAIFPCY